MRLRKKRKLSVGLDIGSKVIKVVVLSNSGAKNPLPRLISYAIRNITNGGEAPSDAQISELLKEIFQETGISEKDVRSAVSGNSAVVRYVNLRKMTREEMQDSIKFEAAKHIPFDVKQVEIDFSILEEQVPTDSRMMKVLLVAAKKDECNRLINIIKSAGLHPTVMDVDSIALMNGYLFANGRESETSPIALVSVGARKTSVDIVDNDKPAFTRNIEIGGDGMTVAIARGMNVDIQEAERMKVFGDALLDEQIQMVLDSLTRQLRTSFDYYEGLSGKDVSGIHLSGGTAMLRGFPEYLTEKLGIPVDILDPLASIDTEEFKSDEELETVRSALDVAVGLALRGN